MLLGRRKENAAIHLHWNVNHKRSLENVEALRNLYRTFFFHVSEDRRTVSREKQFTDRITFSNDTLD
jgi:hypothetical protein